MIRSAMAGRRPLVGRSRRLARKRSDGRLACARPLMHSMACRRSPAATAPQNPTLSLCGRDARRHIVRSGERTPQTRPPQKRGNTRPPKRATHPYPHSNKLCMISDEVHDGFCRRRLPPLDEDAVPAEGLPPRRPAAVEAPPLLGRRLKAERQPQLTARRPPANLRAYGRRVRSAVGGREDAARAGGGGRNKRRKRNRNTETKAQQLHNTYTTLNSLY